MKQNITKIETDEYKVTYTNKLPLSNNYVIQIVESINKSKPSVVNISSSASFKIKKVGEIPLKTVAIFLTQDDSFVGFISANMHKDNTASLIMSGINYVPLPQNLDNLRNYLLHQKKQDVAIYVDEKYQRKGIGKKLIYIMLRYLAEQGVTNVKVSGIKDDVALKTYISTGALQTGEKTAVYENINQFIEMNTEHKKL